MPEPFGIAFKVQSSKFKLQSIRIKVEMGIGNGNRKKTHFSTSLLKHIPFQNYVQVCLINFLLVFFSGSDHSLDLGPIPQRKVVHSGSLVVKCQAIFYSAIIYYISVKRTIELLYKKLSSVKESE